MEKKTVKLNKQLYVPQFQIRSGLRGGESVEACQNNVNYWQKEYDRWYKQAQKDCK